ncbi:hypothetical protein JW935_17270 [candidate division KSB1 bacterium]|nr:hypothetical protein [candidate division KSB1 bacterium]
MSIKNKAIDRDQNGRIKRKYTGKHLKTWYRTPPKSYRKQINRELHAKNTQILRDGAKCGYQDMTFIPFKRTIHWDWW